MKMLLFVFLFLTACSQDQLPTFYYAHFMGNEFHYINGPFLSEADCRKWSAENLIGDFATCETNNVCEVVVCHKLN